MKHSTWGKIALLISVVLFTICSSINFAQAHEGHHNKAPTEACANQQLGSQCQYSDAQQEVLYKGTCQSFDEVTMCVRNQPLVYLKHLQHVPVASPETKTPAVKE